MWKVVNGEPDMLFGYPVYTTTKLDGIESGNKPVLFGNFNFYYIAERGNRVIRRLSERYAEYGQVGFIGTQRIDESSLTLKRSNRLKSNKLYQIPLMNKF